MFTVPRLARFARPARPPHAAPRRRSNGVAVESLEGRRMFAFNAYIAGADSGVKDVTASFVFSTTGQAAKQWVVNWGDGNSNTYVAPDALVGWTSPQTFTHTYNDFSEPGEYAITATATSTTNVTAPAVLAGNSAYGPDGTGKKVQALPSGNTTGTNIASVTDDDNNTYVLTVDGKRMAVTRFTPSGALDTGAGWTTTGTYTLTNFTGVNNQDTPKAIEIDNTNNYLYVAGTSNNKWAIARLNIDYIRTTPEAWKTSILTGTANALWVDSTDGFTTMGVAGTSSSTIQMAMLHTIDNVGQGITGGTLDVNWGTNGVATAPSSIYHIPSPYAITAEAADIVEGDDVGIGGEEWYVSGTVAYCCGSATPPNGSDMVIIRFNETGSPTAGWGRGDGAALFTSCCASCIVGSATDSNYAMVPYNDGGTNYLTLVGATGNTQVLSERFRVSNGTPDTTNYGPLVPLGGGTRYGFAYGPSGVAYAAALDTNLNKIVASGTVNANDFLALRLNSDGSLDTTFGQNGSIKIDFGTTSNNTTDGARGISVRTVNGVTSILVTGYTFDSASGKYRIAMVDLHDDKLFEVT